MLSLKLVFNLTVCVVVLLSLTGFVSLSIGMKFQYKTPLSIQNSEVSCILIPLDVERNILTSNLERVDIHFTTMTFLAESYLNEDIFMGIAPISEIDLFLEDVPYLLEDPNGFFVNNYMVDFKEEFINGTQALNMTLEPNWIKWAKGREISMTWSPTEGQFGVIILNYDFSMNHWLRYRQGTRDNLLFWTGMVFILGGLLAILVGMVLIFSLIMKNRKVTSFYDLTGEVYITQQEPNHIKKTNDYLKMILIILLLLVYLIYYSQIGIWFKDAYKF